MSRKAKVPISLPKGVEISVLDNVVTVKGQKGTLTQEVKQGISINVEADKVHVLRDDSLPDMRKWHGLYFALISNMITGVSKGFEKKLEMIGVGYRASVQGTEVDLQVGCSHPVRMKIPSELKVLVDKNTKISISGADKQQVGEFAAKIRAKRPPEPYKGKGIRYEGEYVRRKAGKSAKR